MADPRLSDQRECVVCHRTFSSFEDFTRHALGDELCGVYDARSDAVGLLTILSEWSAGVLSDGQILQAIQFRPEFYRKAMRSMERTP